MAVVLVVDDEVLNRKVATKILQKEGFSTLEAVDGNEALNILKDHKVDLILMDLMMPNMDGFEATKIIKSDEKLSSIPLIIISALSDKNSILEGLELGANEYLTKPFDLIEFRLRVKNSVKLGEYQNFLKDNEKFLQQQVDEKTAKLSLALEEIKNSEKDIISILAKSAEYRDNETSMHTVRVGEISALMAEHFGMSEDEVELLRLASPMHDIGKVGTPDAILLKPAKLSDEEFAIMKKHSLIGHSILSHKRTPLLHLASQIALYHHEKYDGSGYPYGLIANDIPLSARIVAVVDVFDALLSERPYKKAFSLEKTLSILQSDSGKHFDPDVVDIFMKNIDQILVLRDKFSDDA